MKIKILTLLGTRPEIIRLSRIINKFDSLFNHVIVNSNQNFDKNLNSVFFKNLKIRKSDYSLNCKNNRPATFISELCKKFDEILDKEKPDAVLILGDTNTGLATIFAKKRAIPIFHIEAGNRCYDARVPEEINRKIIDNLADVNLTYSEVAKQNLIRENFPPDRVIKIGSPLFEVLKYYKDDIEKSTILTKLKLSKKNYFLISTHREENLDNKKNYMTILNTMKFLYKKFKLPIIVTTHPRLRKKLKQNKVSKNKNILFSEPFNYFDYIKLQIHAKLTISDSGSIVEEANILNFPAINFRETTERHEGLEEGCCLFSGMKYESILGSINLILKSENSKINRIHSDYCVEGLSNNVAKIIQSYKDYINTKVWFK